MPDIEIEHKMILLLESIDNRLRIIDERLADVIRNRGLEPPKKGLRALKFPPQEGDLAGERSQHHNSLLYRESHRSPER